MEAAAADGVHSRSVRSRERKKTGGLDRWEMKKRRRIKKKGGPLSLSLDALFCPSGQKGTFFLLLVVWRRDPLDLRSVGPTPVPSFPPLSKRPRGTIEMSPPSLHFLPPWLSQSTSRNPKPPSKIDRSIPGQPTGEASPNLRGLKWRLLPPRPSVSGTPRCSARRSRFAITANVFGESVGIRDGKDWCTTLDGKGGGRARRHDDGNHFAPSFPSPSPSPIHQKCFFFFFFPLFFAPPMTNCPFTHSALWHLFPFPFLWEKMLRHFLVAAETPFPSSTPQGSISHSARAAPERRYGIRCSAWAGGKRGLVYDQGCQVLRTRKCHKYFAQHEWHFMAFLLIKKFRKILFFSENGIKNAHLATMHATATVSPVRPSLHSALFGVFKVGCLLLLLLLPLLTSSGVVLPAIFLLRENCNSSMVRVVSLCLFVIID